MFGLGMPELIVILVICLLIFGAAKLPEIGKSMGKTISEFKKGMRNMDLDKTGDEDKKEETGKKIPIDLKRIPADLLSISSHKIYGPKGVGALFVREGTKLEPLLHGGGQEMGLRSGTENVAGAVGFAKAADMAVKEMKRNPKKIELLLKG